jgi:hypothetical protein
MTIRSTQHIASNILHYKALGHLLELLHIHLRNIIQLPIFTMKFTLFSIFVALPAIMAAPLAAPEAAPDAAPAAAPEAVPDDYGQYADYGDYPPPDGGYGTYADYGSY